MCEYNRPSQLELVVKTLPADAGDLRVCVRYLGQEDPLEEGTTTHSSLLAWRNAHGQRSLAGYSPQGFKGLDMTAVTWHARL